MGDEKETSRGGERQEGRKRGRETEEGTKRGREGTRSSVGRELGEDLGRVGDEHDQNTLYEILKDK